MMLREGVTDTAEVVQRQFLVFVLRSLAWVLPVALAPYDNRLKLVNVPSLQKKREMLDTLFRVKLMKDVISTPALL